MKKLLFIGLFLITLSACNRNVDSALQDYVTKNMKGDKGTLKLSDYKEVAWDTIYILDPYCTNKMFDAILKPYSKEIFSSGIDTDDKICLVMLFNGKKLVSQSVFYRNQVDFSGLTRFAPNAKYKALSKGGAVFKYSRPKEYTPYVLSF